MENNNVKTEGEKRTPFQSAYDWIEIIGISLAAVIVFLTFFARVTTVVGDSMLPTLHDGESLFVLCIGYEPENGDIVVVQNDRSMVDYPIVKRIIGTGGDTIGFDFENVWDIVPGKTPVLKSAETNIPDKITVSAGEIYALPFEVTYIASNNEKIAKIESDNAIKGVFEGNTSIEIITASGNFEVVEISVIEEGGFIVSVVKKITALFAAIFESLSEFFFKG